MSSPKEFFAKNGYFHARGVFSPEEVRELEKDFDRIVHQLTAKGEDANARWAGEANEKAGSRGTVVLHTHNVQKFSAAWLRAFMHPKFLEVPKIILGPNIVLHHSKLFQKPAEKGAPFPMHQDWTYFPTMLDTMIAGIIHVSRADDKMGCLRVVPGSHKLGRVEKSDGQSSVKFSERFPLDDAMVVEAEPGDVVFFHYFTAHGSKPNRSDQTRKTVLVQMHSGEDQVEDANRHPNERLPLAGWNSYATRASAGEAT